MKTSGNWINRCMPANLRPLFACCISLLLLGGAASARAGGTAEAYSGRAYVLSVNTPLLPPVTVSDTGPLPESGGALEKSLLQYSAPGLVSTEVCHAVVVGEGDASHAAAAAGRTSLTAGANVIAFDAVWSWAHASCCSDGASVSGMSGLVSLTVNGLPVNVSGQPNQTVSLPGGRIIINEQVTCLDGDYAAITVNALHVVIDGVTDLVVCSSHADIVCGGAQPPPPPQPPAGEADCDKLTGGGWITGTPSGAKGNFGVAGGIRDGAFWGHLNYVDHGNNMHVKHTAVTGYSVDPGDPDCRIITYNVTIDGMPGTATVRACDKGEPGRDDIFEITLSNGYRAAGDLGGSRPGGGNIQLHKCPTGWE